MAATTTTRKAAPKKGAAARAATTEQKVATKKIKAAGLTFTIPAEMPGILLLHFGDMEGGKMISPVQDVLKDTLGENQYAGLVASIREQKLNGQQVGDLLGSLTEQITEAYGLTEGE